MTIAANGFAVGLRTNDASTTAALVNSHGWKIVSDNALQVDLSVDLDAGPTTGPRQIGSVRHGDRAVLRSHNADRLLAAAGVWLDALVFEPPPTRLTSMNLAEFDDGKTLAVPRWVTADSALMDRLLPSARWLDGAWIELQPTPDGTSCVGPDGVLRQLDVIVLDDTARPLDFSTAARRAGAVFGWITSPDATTTLDTAGLLARALPFWHSVSTENIPAACRSIAHVATTSLNLE